MVPKLEGSTSSGNLLEMQIIMPQARTTESETMRVGPATCVPKSPPGNSQAHRSLRSTGVKKAFSTGSPT